MEFQVQTDAASAGAGAVGNTQILDTPRHNSDTTQVTPRYYPSTTQVLLRYYSDNPLGTTQVTPLHHSWSYNIRQILHLRRRNPGILIKRCRKVQFR